MENKINLLHHLLPHYGFKSLTDYEFKFYNYKICNEQEKQLIININKYKSQISEIFGFSQKITTSDQAIKLLRDIFDDCKIEYLVSRSSKSSFTKLLPKESENNVLVGNFVFDIENETQIYNKYSLIGDKRPEYADEMIKITEKPIYTLNDDSYEYNIYNCGDLISEFLFIIDSNTQDQFKNFNVESIINNINICLQINLPEKNFNTQLKISKIFKENDKIYIVCSLDKWIHCGPYGTKLKFKIINKDLNVYFKKFYLYCNYAFIANTDIRNNILKNFNIYNINQSYDTYLGENIIPENVPSTIHESKLDFINTKKICINVKDLKLGYLKAVLINHLPKRAMMIINGLYRFNLSSKLMIYYQNLHNLEKNNYIIPLQNHNKKMSFLYTDSPHIDEIFLNLEFENEINCTIMFETYNEYINNSYDSKIYNFFSTNYQDYKIINSPSKIMYKEIIVCTHFLHDEFCPPNYRLLESKTEHIGSEIFRISKYKYVLLQKDVLSFEIPPHCFVYTKK